MKESLKWKSNGLPRKGWILFDVIDTDELSMACEWCGTSIRYVHIIKHVKDNLTSECGIICAEHLTQDYVNHRSREKILKSLSAKKRNHLSRFNKAAWLLSKNANLYLKFDSNLIVIIGKNAPYKLSINNIFSKKQYQTMDEAKESAYNYISQD